MSVRHFGFFFKEKVRYFMHQYWSVSLKIQMLAFEFYVDHCSSKCSINLLVNAYFPLFSFTAFAGYERIIDCYHP